MNFRWKQHQQGITFGFIPCSSTDSVDVGVGVLGAINLDDPVYSWEINTSSRNIRTKQDSMFFLNELEINSCALVLILFAMKFE